MCSFVSVSGGVGGWEISFADEATGFNLKKKDQTKNNRCDSGGFSLQIQGFLRSNCQSTGKAGYKSSL